MMVIFIWVVAMSLEQVKNGRYPEESLNYNALTTTLPMALLG